MKGSVLVIGLYGQSALHAVKRLPLPGESILSTEIQFEPGGKGYNQALSACRMGCRTVFATAVGADLWGTQAEQCFKDSGFSQYRAISVCCFANKLRKIFIQSAKKKRRLKGF